MAELRDDYLDYLTTSGLLDARRFQPYPESRSRRPSSAMRSRRPGEPLPSWGGGEVSEAAVGPGEVWGAAASVPTRAAVSELVPYLMRSVSKMAPYLSEAMQAAGAGRTAPAPVREIGRDLPPQRLPAGRFQPTDPEEDAMSALLGRLVRGEATPDETQEIRNIVEEYHRLYRQGGTSRPIARDEADAMETTGGALDPWEKGAQKGWEKEADDPWGREKIETPEPPQASTPTPRRSEPTSAAIGRTSGDYDTGLLKMLLQLSDPKNADYRDMAEGQLRHNLGRTVDRPVDDPWRP